MGLMGLFQAPASRRVLQFRGVNYPRLPSTQLCVEEQRVHGKLIEYAGVSSPYSPKSGLGNMKPCMATKYMTI